MQSLIQLAANTAGVSTTIQNILTVAQVIGGGLAGVMIVIAGIKFMMGGREALQGAKSQAIGIVVGLILVIGATGIKSLIQGLSGF